MFIFLVEIFSQESGIYLDSKLFGTRQCVNDYLKEEGMKKDKYSKERFDNSRIRAFVKKKTVVI